MRRTINGIETIIHSPSVYEIVITGGVVLRQTLVCLGPEQWLLHTWLLSGQAYGSEFRSRDHALNRVAIRRQHAQAFVR